MSVIARASLVEYFKDQVEGALAQQQVPASGDTAHYVVQLLVDTLRHDSSSRAVALLDGRPLALRLADAMDERCPAPGRALRDVADAALLLGGYFAPHASDRALPPTYYRQVGGFAYGALGRESVVLGPIFRDLAERFSQYADALGEVGRRAEMQTPAGLVRALELWSRSRDRVTERLLVERGVVLPRRRRASVQ
ncbi:hypothetical protein TBR22_A48020 [Luteitalea sp. TBR-22]|uniref:hypothetical protein n=1 Tax=Luteitalea sp. TBR-22 TaxID=2802971 RepID=UPI001AF94587|nr:hypothetical protein [Luteitalea sp. TBR-22]BCS35568.1 hypothetical protein TBR22_A48020 [Luteitalea sp. TBR-22]